MRERILCASSSVTGEVSQSRQPLTSYGGILSLVVILAPRRVCMRDFKSDLSGDAFRYRGYNISSTYHIGFNLDITPWNPGSVTNDKGGAYSAYPFCVGYYSDGCLFPPRGRRLEGFGYHLAPHATGKSRRFKVSCRCIAFKACARAVYRDLSRLAMNGYDGFPVVGFVVVVHSYT